MADRYPIHYAKVLATLMEDVSEQDRPAALDAFIAFLYKEQSLGDIPYIIDSFEQLMEAKEGKSRISVTSAHTLTSDMQTQIAKIFGVAEIHELVVDPELIGGVVIRQDNTVFDASIATTIQKLHSTLS
jgi:F-type H+-transporting ATPase subunit delta